jgi:hypothetical protein
MWSAVVLVVFAGVSYFLAWDRMQYWWHYDVRHGEERSDGHVRDLWDFAQKWWGAGLAFLAGTGFLIAAIVKAAQAVAGVADPIVHLLGDL